MFGRITRLAFDLTAISVFIAGVKRSTGYAPATTRIKDAALRHFFETYFGYGDMIYAMICGVVVRSSYFRRTIEEP